MRKFCQISREKENYAQCVRSQSLTKYNKEKK